MSKKPAGGRLPWFKFYPADWVADPSLRMCGFSARGLWLEMLCLMLRSERVGYLSFNGSPMTTGQLARLVGGSEKEVAALLQELRAAGVFSEDEAGIFCRRMVRDAEQREVDRENGRLGGNPNLKAGGNPSPPPKVKPNSKGGVNPPDNPPVPVGVKAEAEAEAEFSPVFPNPAEELPDPKADPRHRAITARIGQLHQAATGQPVVVSGRDVTALKKFLTTWKGTADEFLTTAERAWKRGRQDSFARNCLEASSLAGLCQRWPQVLAELDRKPAAKAAAAPQSKNLNGFHVRPGAV